MKNNLLALSLVLLLTNLQVFASADVFSRQQRCEQITLQSSHSDQNLMDLIHTDLVKHVWKTLDDQGKAEWYAFDADGSVQVIHDEPGSVDHTIQNWSLIQVNDNILLRIAGSDQVPDRMLRVQQNCDGLLWIDVMDLGVTFVDYMGLKEEEQNVMNVAGNWMWNTEKMLLKEDGSYEVRNDKGVERGNWQIFHRDGFIILLPENSGQMDFLKIKHLDYSHLDIWRATYQNPEECNERVIELAAFEKEQHL